MSDKIKVELAIEENSVILPQFIGALVNQHDELLDYRTLSEENWDDLDDIDEDLFKKIIAEKKKLYDEKFDRSFEACKYSELEFMAIMESLVKAFKEDPIADVTEEELEIEIDDAKASEMAGMMMFETVIEQFATLHDIDNDEAFGHLAMYYIQGETLDIDEISEISGYNHIFEEARRRAEGEDEE